jgi:hypothetical protein
MRLRRPGLHDNAPKKVTTSLPPPLPRPQWSRIFTRSPSEEREATSTPSRGSRHPQASPSMAPKRWAFARNNPHRNWSLSLPGTPEPSFYRAIWALSTPRRVQHQELPTPTPRHPRGPKRRPSPLPRRPPPSRPCSPPSGAAAPASASSAGVARSNVWPESLWR